MALFFEQSRWTCMGLIHASFVKSLRLGDMVGVKEYASILIRQTVKVLGEIYDAKEIDVGFVYCTLYVDAVHGFKNIPLVKDEKINCDRMGLSVLCANLDVFCGSVGALDREKAAHAGMKFLGHAAKMLDWESSIFSNKVAARNAVKEALGPDIRTFMYREIGQVKAEDLHEIKAVDLFHHMTKVFDIPVAEFVEFEQSKESELAIKEAVAMTIDPLADFLPS